MAYTKETDARDVARDLYSQIKGKTVLVTGASSKSLGVTFAQIIAENSPKFLILTGRDVAKSVRKAAEEVNTWADVTNIDVLVNNAGIMAQPFQLTEDGFESQLATCFLGHFLFTNLIMGKILKSVSPRVVNVSSNGHRFGPFRFDYNFKEGEVYDMWQAYGQAKSGNILFSVALAQKLASKGLIAGGGAAVMHQADLALGTAQSLASGPTFDFKSPEQGVSTHVFTAFAPEVAENNGGYYLDCRPADFQAGEVYSWATNRSEALRVWKVAEKLVGQEFEY